MYMYMYIFSSIPTGTTTSRPSITTTTVSSPTTLVSRSDIDKIILIENLENLIFVYEQATMFLFWDAKEKQWMFTPTLGKL